MSNDSNSESKRSELDVGLPRDRSRVPSSVRARVLRHMRKLVARTAAAGTALQLSGCDHDLSRAPVGFDPLPPPVDCTTNLTSGYLSEWASGWAQWKEGDGPATIEVTVFLDTPSGELTLSGEPLLEGATLVESEVHPVGNSLTFACIPEEGATTVNVTVPVRCENVNAALRLALDVSDGPQPGQGVPVTMTE